MSRYGPREPPNSSLLERVGLNHVCSAVHVGERREQVKVFERVEVLRLGYRPDDGGLENHIIRKDIRVLHSNSLPQGVLRHLHELVGRVLEGRLGEEILGVAYGAPRNALEYRRVVNCRVSAGRRSVQLRYEHLG